MRDWNNIYIGVFLDQAGIRQKYYVPKFDLTRVRTHGLQIMTVYFMSLRRLLLPLGHQWLQMTSNIVRIIVSTSIYKLYVSNILDMIHCTIETFPLNSYHHFPSLYTPYPYPAHFAFVHFMQTTNSEGYTLMNIATLHNFHKCPQTTFMHLDLHIAPFISHPCYACLPWSLKLSAIKFH